MGRTYPVVSVAPYALITGAMVIEINSCVSREIGAAAVRQILSCPPVASLTLLNTTESSIADPGRPDDMRNLVNQYSSLLFLD